MKRLTIKALLLLTLGSMAFAPTAVQVTMQATAAHVQMAWAHFKPDCPALPCG